MFDTETVGPYLVQKLKWGGGGGDGPPGPPVATPLKNLELPIKSLQINLAM